MLNLEIREDDLTGPKIVRFLRDHLDYMYAVTPPESVHAFDLERLRVPGVSFWSAWADGGLLGCGALHELDPASGEIKSMRTAPVHRGKGVGSRILEHLIAVARQRRPGGQRRSAARTRSRRAPWRESRSRGRGSSAQA